MGNTQTGDMGNAQTGDMGNTQTGDMGNAQTGDMGNTQTGDMGNTWRHQLWHAIIWPSKKKGHSLCHGTQKSHWRKSVRNS